MSDLFGNHIVGFPTKRLIYGIHEEAACLKVLAFYEQQIEKKVF